MAIQLAADVSSVLADGQFHLRKWKSNSAEVLAHLLGDADPCQLNPHLAETTVLGLHWDPLTDELFYQVSSYDAQHLTKRQVLSDAAKLYDPIGMLAPVIITAKLFIQKLWQAKLAWDDPLPLELLQEWLIYRRQLSQLEAVRIPRWIGMQPGYQIQLHGFCDASVKAMAAALYLATNHNGSITSHIITSKTKVAPLHSVTVPRLELCAAQLLATLLHETRQALHLEHVPYTLYSDSNIALCWLRKNPSQLKQYVANRVGCIQSMTDIRHWHHIPTKLNPADCASRGISPLALQNYALWWHGPNSTDYSINELHHCAPAELAIMEGELKPVKVKALQVIGQPALQTHYTAGDELVVIDLLDRFSHLGKLLRTTAYILRCKKAHHRFRSHTHICTGEMDIALNHHIKAEQAKYFAAEIKQLKKAQPISTSSKIIALSPFINSTADNILRVGGRLHNARVAEPQRHPIILPKDSTLARLLIWQVHQDTLHGGIQIMLHTIRHKYWILQARILVKQCIHLCAICRRHKHIMLKQRMATLPKARVTPSPPFARSGLDYCGPFNIRIGSKAVRTVRKAYVAIFVCMVTKAVHIELAEDLTSEAFINAYTRFVNRRGPCNHLYSDNGTTFIGADRLMAADLQAWHNEYSQQQLANRGTKWHFLPPGAPHQGGLWEAAVKSAKKHLLRIVGIHSIYYDQLHTLLVHIEACLNSRPLIPLHDTCDDKMALSPADFLIGRSLLAVPDAPIGKVPSNKLSYWRQLRQMQQHFWRQWHDEYLSTLQPRSKWHQNGDNINIGDVVVIRHENLPATHWRLGRVIKLHPGEDGLVRVVTIKHSAGECMRPIQKICRLVEHPERTRPAGEDV
ncbi:uncharacterized protein LOC119689319 [Teleopsis dalmanni]|uniref:uncharacterized protein LOC119689319 n=1 Tax=Teleopsis dalmanni TaxID=139649 RepID=UPI0018CFC708|nr:uncharacterized protein LOC119689319 [Teleopsis dalmanni]